MTPSELRPDDLAGLDDASRRVLDLALEEGRLFQQDYIGTEHILAGLLRSRDPIVAETLHAFDVEIDDVRTTLHTIIASGLMPEPPQNEVFTRRARRVLDVARTKASGERARPPHLLFALLSESGGVASQILTALDLDNLELAAALEERLARPA